jgi:MFS family permease
VLLRFELLPGKRQKTRLLKVKSQDQCSFLPNMHKSVTGTWMPAWVPESTKTLAILLMICSMVQSTTHGYDGSMLNGLNILPSYTDYFHLTPATKGLNTASVFIGKFISFFTAGILTDRLGRRPAIFWSSIIIMVGNVLQTASQHTAMFVIARAVMGWGIALSDIAAPVYITETFPSQYRAWGSGLLNNFYYIGALIAAGITLGTSQWDSTWAWRLPSLLQVIFAFACIAILPFVPESPRWLVSQELYEAARSSVADCNTQGDITDPVAVAIYKEIFDTLEWEKNEGKKTTPMEIIADPVSVKRVCIGGSTLIFSTIAGNNIAAYYLGPLLSTAGITDSQAQLKVVSPPKPPLPLRMILCPRKVAKSWISRMSYSTFGVCFAP